MKLDILLAGSVLLLALLVNILIHRVQELTRGLSSTKKLYYDQMRDTRDWERKYYDTFTDLTTRENELREAHVRLDASEDGEALSPTSHNVPDVPTEDIMAESNDPIWDLVIECRREGVLGEWVMKVRPDMLNAQPHRQYAEFGTWILNDGDDQTVESVRNRLRQLPLPTFTPVKRDAAGLPEEI